MKPTTEEQRKELAELAKPILKWLNDNFHPHVCVVIDPGRAELLERQCVFVTEDFIKD